MTAKAEAMAALEEEAKAMTEMDKEVLQEDADSIKAKVHCDRCDEDKARQRALDLSKAKAMEHITNLCHNNCLRRIRDIRNLVNLCLDSLTDDHLNKA